MEKRVKAKILIYDLELTPQLGWTYGSYDTRMLYTEARKLIMSFSYMWYGENKIHHIRITDEELDNWNDKQIAIQLRDLLSEADIVVAHNAYRFDNRESMTAIVVNGLTPPKPFKTVDTLRVAKRFFRFSENSLDSLGDMLGVGRKSPIKQGELWRDCVIGRNEKSWKLLKKYNDQDVKVLAGIYEKLRPFTSNHPNMGDISQIHGVCPKCGSPNLKREGTHARANGRVVSYSCKDCGGWCCESTINKNGRIVNEQ